MSGAGCSTLPLRFHALTFPVCSWACGRTYCVLSERAITVVATSIKWPRAIAVAGAVAHRRNPYER